ncbi:MAG TPA: hypothetical protein VF607_12205, partial [Verrucomicrobiae bacterium]
VDLINGYGADLPIRPATARATSAPKTSAAAPDDSFNATETLQSAQNQSAASRPDKIARAKELLADGNYPSDQDLNKLAGHLSSRL